jgi:hypothetical protein
MGCGAGANPGILSLMRTYFVFGSLVSISFLAATASAGELVAVGTTGYSLEAPDGFRAAVDREADVLLRLVGPAGKRSVEVVRGAAGATGQVLAERFEERLRRDLSGLRYRGQERVRIAETGAQLRRYEGMRKGAKVLVLVLVFVKGPTRLVLAGEGPPGSAELLETCLESLVRTGPVEEPPEEGVEPEEGDGSEGGGEPPEGGEPSGVPSREPHRWIELRGTGHRIRVPRDWTGGPDARAKGTRITDPKRGCILDVAVYRSGGEDRGDRVLEKVADEFEEQLLAAGAGWRRTESRRERIEGRTVRMRRYEGRPGGIPCEFHVLITSFGEVVFLAKAIFARHLSERYAEPVGEALRSIRRR